MLIEWVCRRATYASQAVQSPFASADERRPYEEEESARQESMRRGGHKEMIGDAHHCTVCTRAVDRSSAVFDRLIACRLLVVPHSSCVCSFTCAGRLSNAEVPPCVLRGGAGDGRGRHGGGDERRWYARGRRMHSGVCNAAVMHLACCSSLQQMCCELGETDSMDART
jgi:hypothetical protein